TLVMDRFRLLERMTAYIDLRARPVTSSLALLSGFVGSISGGGGLYFLVVYLKLACKSALSLRSTNIMLSGVFILIRLILLVYAGFVSWPIVVESLFLTPAVLLGSWMGTRLFHASSPERFFAALQVLLLIASLSLMVRGVVKIL
ncbi:MAG: TSUP family transporter, partial [Alphaproteobacteria bacterium]